MQASRILGVNIINSLSCRSYLKEQVVLINEKRVLISNFLDAVIPSEDVLGLKSNYVSMSVIIRIDTL